MLYQIVSHTPAWVWALLAGLGWLGLKQTVASTVGLGRVTVMPLAMTGLSLYGTLSTLGTQTVPLIGWLVAACLLVGATLHTTAPAGARYDTAASKFTLPGSWVPLALMMGIFATKYAVGTTLALQPAMAHEPVFAMVVGSVYGAFSGVFCGRAVRLLRLVQRAQETGAAGLA